MLATRRQAATGVRGLYVIIDPTLTNNRDPAWVAECALKGGASALQFRDKASDKGDSLPLVQRLVALCRDHNAVCVVNDHADLAVAAGADGVHLGQHDLPLTVAREMLHPWQFIGSSNALAGEAISSYQAGAEYIAIGSMFNTSSKLNTRWAGPDTLRQIHGFLPVERPPLVAIGGITRQNVALVAQAGADGICVISTVTAAEDPEAAARELLEAFREAQKGDSVTIG